MWLLIQKVFPNNALDAWVLVMGFWFWVAAVSWKEYAIRQFPSTLFWTDVLNMITVDLFNGLPTWWWAHGWTIALLPWIGKLWVSFLVWIVTVMLFGPTLWYVGFGLKLGG